MDRCSLYDRGGIGLRAQPSGPGHFERPSAESAGGGLRTRCRDGELHDCLLHPLPLLGLSQDVAPLSAGFFIHALTSCDLVDADLGRLALCPVNRTKMFYVKRDLRAGSFGRTKWLG